MRKKKWTAQINITESLLKSREKRKWQIALRRYVLERKKCSYYAPYFGIGNIEFRQWIELQFDEETKWENFGEKWQLEHVIPSSYFDFEKEEEMKLCWNFLNIQLEKKSSIGIVERKIDLIAARSFFARIYQRTSIMQCKKMLEWLERVEQDQIQRCLKYDEFLVKKGENLNEVCSFSAYEFDQLNAGIPIGEIIKEREVLKKYGGENNVP